MNNTHYTPATVTACTALTGAHPVDLVGQIEELGDVLRELRELFRAIHNASALGVAEHPALILIRIHGLSGAGCRIACETADLADNQREGLETALHTHGAVCDGGGS